MSIAMENMERVIFRNWRISQQQINEAIEVANFQKLPELQSDNLTLEVQLPNIFNLSTYNQPSVNRHRSSVRCLPDQQLLTLGSNRNKNKKNAIILGLEQKQRLLKKVSNSNICFYSLVKMLFPEAPSLPPLSIDIMDTIFYNLDGTMTYVYTDSKKGLRKTKSKNYIELFFKRKCEIDFHQQWNIKMGQSSSQFSKSIRSNNSKRQQFKNLDYVALLRYKDESFIRLKEHQFKSIFIRPVQANQKYKIFNNTLYLQLIPHQINYEEGTIFNIQFNLATHEKTQLFQRAVQKHCQETSSYATESKMIKNQIKQMSIQAHLLYIVYEVYAYVNIHYHKQITTGIFQFMKVGDTFYLFNARQIEMDQSENVKTYYASQNLFEQFVQAETEFDCEKEKQNNGLLKQLHSIFATQNSKICQRVSTFVSTKISDIQNKKDQEESNSIFHLINNRYQQSLHQLLSNDAEYQKFLLKKQDQSDGYSHLTSISNICRRKQTRNMNQGKGIIKVDNQNSTKREKGLGNRQKINFNNIFWLDSQNVSRERPLKSKWVKQSLNGKKQYFVEKI